MPLGGKGASLSAVGAPPAKEVSPMMHFLRDVLAAFVANVLAAVVVRLINR